MSAQVKCIFGWVLVALCVAMTGCQSVLKGVRIDGAEVVFLIDVSNSMSGMREAVLPQGRSRVLDAAVREVQRLEVRHARLASEVLAMLSPKKAPARSRSKLDVAKLELAQVIDNLPVNTRFSVVAFAEGVAAWQATLVPASLDNKQAAQRFIAEMTTQSGTSLGKALDTALAMMPTGQVVLITDGSPTDRSPEQILQQVRVHARGHATQVTTVGLGEDQNQALLQGIAQLTAARYYKR